MQERLADVDRAKEMLLGTKVEMEGLKKELEEKEKEVEEERRKGEEKTAQVTTELEGVRKEMVSVC